jgi:hypothetical protein
MIINFQLNKNVQIKLIGDLLRIIIIQYNGNNHYKFEERDLKSWIIPTSLPINRIVDTFLAKVRNYHELLTFTTLSNAQIKTRQWNDEMVFESLMSKISPAFYDKLLLHTKTKPTNLSELDYALKLEFQHQNETDYYHNNNNSVYNKNNTLVAGVNKLGMVHPHYPSKRIYNDINQQRQSQHRNQFNNNTRGRYSNNSYGNYPNNRNGNYPNNRNNDSRNYRGGGNHYNNNNNNNSTYNNNNNNNDRGRRNNDRFDRSRNNTPGPKFREFDPEYGLNIDHGNNKPCKYRCRLCNSQWHLQKECNTSREIIVKFQNWKSRRSNNSSFSRSRSGSRPRYPRTPRGRNNNNRYNNNNNNRNNNNNGRYNGQRNYGVNSVQNDNNNNSNNESKNGSNSNNNNNNNNGGSNSNYNGNMNNNNNNNNNINNSNSN